VVPELQKREKEANSFRLRLKLAMTLHRLGDSMPLAKLATEIAQGKEPKEPFAPVDQRTIGNMWDIKSLEETTFIRTLIAAQLPETEQALMAFTKPTHPLYSYFASRFKFEHRHQNRDFTGHSYCLPFLREVLQDTTPTGVNYHVENGKLIEESGNSRGIGTPYGELKDPANRREKVEGRRCDEQMMRMREVIFGVIEFHPLFKDAQERFDRNLKWINSNTFRPMTEYEATQFNNSCGALVPYFKPLTHLATKADVEALNAAFFLDGQASCINITLPAWMVLKKDVSGTYVNRRGLILQAEELMEKKQYGVLYADGLKTIKEEEVLRIEPYEPVRK
jgi:hypothetical protein